MIPARRRVGNRSSLGASASIVSSRGALTPHGILRKKLSIFSFDLFLHVRARARGEREILHPFIGTSGVDYGAGAEAFAILRDHRIERAAPGAADEVRVVGRIGARAQGPEH